MLRRGTLIRSRFVRALETIAAAAGGGGGGPSITYLLQHLFSRSNQSLNDGDILTEGVGSLTMVESGSGSVAVNTNAMRVTGDATITNTGFYGDGITRAAGKQFFIQSNQSSNTTTSHKLGLWSSGTIADANRVALVGNVNGVAISESFSPAGTAADSFTTGLATSAAADRQWCITTGGFDSSGVPSASGAYGHHTYYYDGTNWNLVAASTDLNTATVYPGVQASTSSAGYADVLDCIIPTAADTSVFTPSGYALDTMTDTENTALTSHTPDAASGSWSALNGTSKIVSNTARVNSLGSGSECTQALETGMSDCFQSIGWSATAAQFQHWFRITDIDNHWLTEANLSSSNFALYERDGGTTTQRALDSGAVSSGTHTSQARLDGTTLSAWLDGTRKVTYTSSLHQTSTKHGFTLTNNVLYADNFYVLPLTSATYNTAFDTSELTAADCDLYQTFDAIDDVTLANGDVIYGDADDTGTLTVVDSSTGAVDITSNALVINGVDAGHDQTRVYSQQVTPVAGSLLQFDLTVNTAVAPTISGYLDNTSAVITNRLLTAQTNSGSPDWSVRYADGAGTGSTFTTGTHTQGNTYGVSIVTGGYDSAGVPDATGTYGGMVFTESGGTWTLHSTYTGGVDYGVASYASFSHNLTAGTGTWDNIILPDSSTTVESVFTPTGYALSLFDGAFGTDLASYTADTGESYVYAGAATYSLDGAGAASRNAGNGYVCVQKDIGLTEYFASSYVPSATNGAYHGLSVRCDNTSAGNHFNVQRYLSGVTVDIYEVTNTSFALRGQTGLGGTQLPSSESTIYARVTSEGIEGWAKGVLFNSNPYFVKVSYASTSKNTNTGIGMYDNTGNGHDVGHLYALPLTSATYADLDSF